jgi:hypothetical protein
MIEFFEREFFMNFKFSNYLNNSTLIIIFWIIKFSIIFEFFRSKILNSRVALKGNLEPIHF